jgi:histidinol dehydrogenase
VKGIDAAIMTANELAPEHVCVACADEERVAKRITTAGTVCIGKHAAVAFGDYCAGVNHVLPTGGHARSRGGLSAIDFMRHVQYLKVTEPRNLADVGIEIARAEGFTFHEESMRRRKGAG